MDAAAAMTMGAGDEFLLVFRPPTNRRNRSDSRKRFGAALHLPHEAAVLLPAQLRACPISGAEEPMHKPSGQLLPFGVRLVVHLGEALDDAKELRALPPGPLSER
jgi:hypothetical protein